MAPEIKMLLLHLLSLMQWLEPAIWMQILPLSCLWVSWPEATLVWLLENPSNPSLSWLHLLTFLFPCLLSREQQSWGFPGIRQFDLAQKCPRSCHAWEGILRLTMALGSISEPLLLLSCSSNRTVQEWLWAVTLIRRKDPLCPLGTKQALPSGDTDTSMMGEVHEGALGPPLILEGARVRWWVGLELVEEHRVGGEDDIKWNNKNSGPLRMRQLFSHFGTGFPLLELVAVCTACTFSFINDVAHGCFGAREVYYTVTCLFFRSHFWFIRRRTELSDFLGRIGKTCGLCQVPSPGTLICCSVSPQ